MKIWQILTRRQKKYENLAGEVLEGSTKFAYFSVMCMRDFSYLPKFHTFLGRRRGWSAWKDGRRRGQ